MRVALTALDAAGGTHTDVLVTCDERSTVQEVALALQGAPAGAPEPLAIVIRHPRFSEAAAGGPAGRRPRHRGDPLALRGGAGARGQPAQPAAPRGGGRLAHAHRRRRPLLQPPAPAAAAPPRPAPDRSRR